MKLHVSRIQIRNTTYLTVFILKNLVERKGIEIICKTMNSMAL